MSDLVGNPEDRFSHNETHIGTDNTVKMHRLNCAVVVRIMQIFDFITSSSTNLCSIKCNIDIHIIVLSTMIQRSHVIRKPVFCKCENKDADQLRNNCAADQLLCFHYIDSIVPLLS